MIFYNNSLKIKLPHYEIYKIHQYLDFFIQEIAGIKIPYSFKIEPVSANESVVLTRTVQSLKFPGERKEEIFLAKGDLLHFETTLVVTLREKIMGRRRQITPGPEYLNDYVRRRLTMVGFSINSLVVWEPKIFTVIKRDQKILIPASVVHAACIVDSVEMAEKALVYGAGRKRIFGFGLLNLLKVNTIDESC